RAEGASDEFQRPEHRRTAASRRVSRGGLSARERAVVRMARARWAEDLVANLYQRDGYEIIARNWHCREGELDIVAVLQEAKDKIIVVVEVRARASNYFGSALESITPAKQKKLRSAAKKFLASQSTSNGAVRFDVASVMGVKIEIVRDAFELAVRRSQQA
ncbi:MAG: YraN family protein, partial [Acidimicrobiaceae bacterium]